MYRVSLDMIFRVFWCIIIFIYYCIYVVAIHSLIVIKSIMCMYCTCTPYVTLNANFCFPSIY